MQEQIDHLIGLKMQADPDSTGKIFRENLIKAILEDMQFQMNGEDGPGDKNSNGSSDIIKVKNDEDLKSDESPVNFN